MSFEPWKPFHFVAGRPLFLHSGDLFWRKSNPQSPADLNHELRRPFNSLAMHKITTVLTTRQIIRKLLSVNS